MLRILPGLLAALFLSFVPVQAADWPAIPPEVWAITSGAKGAVFLDQNLRYGARDTEVRARIRIYSEAGLPAALMPAMNAIWTLEGRIVRRDGTVIPFNSAKDLLTSSLVVGGAKTITKGLVPPGLTADCVVDYHYQVGTYLWKDWVELPVLENYPVVRKVVQLDASTPLGMNLIVSAQQRPVRISKANYEEFTFFNLPAREEDPYSMPKLFDPRFILSAQVSGLQFAATRGPEPYWQEVVNKVYKGLYVDRLSATRAYREWSKALRSGLAGDPAAQAREIYLRLGERIRNLTQLGEHESAAMGRKEAGAACDPMNLDASVKSGETTGLGLHFLFFRLLVDQGLEPKLLFVVDRRERAFSFRMTNAHQFTDTLIGVRDGAGTLAWFQPEWKFFPAGIVHPIYQGAKGLLVDSRDWSFQEYTPEIQAAEENASRYDFGVGIGENETFRMKAAFTGCPEFAIRQAYAFLPAEEQGRALKEQVEARSRDLTITRAEVPNATAWRLGANLVLEGSRSLEEGRRRVIPPFPGLAFPLDLPEAWPAQRTYPIAFTYREAFTAVSRVQLPPGWKLVEAEDFAQENRFGRITWQARPVAGAEDTWEVTYTLTVASLAASEYGYGQLKAYLGWMETASRKTLVLERP